MLTFFQPGELDFIFTRLLGTLAVILLAGAFISNSSFMFKWASQKSWKFIIIAGLVGGLFGIYGNYSGFQYNGAIISVRDAGPMLAGISGGPVSGLIAGLICGAHRLFMGGVTAPACMVATCMIGLICGFFSRVKRTSVLTFWPALSLSLAMETFHMAIILVMVQPFRTALDIVRHIALPFIVVNSMGFVLLTIIINYTIRQHTLTLEKSRLQSELEVAKVIQHDMLPTITDRYPGRPEVDVGAFMQAAKAVGGDFYDVFFVDSGRLVFVIGDVSGKGVPAAIFMANAKTILQNCVRNDPDLAGAVRTANNDLCARNEAHMFLTLWVGVLDLADKKLTFICAGHNPPVLVKGGQAAFLKKRSGMALAVKENLTYEAYTQPLSAGDILFLYTDGITEADTAQNDLYGEDRLLACFEDTDGLTSDQLIRKVKSSVDGFVAGNSQFDDMTMLCFRVK